MTIPATAHHFVTSANPFRAILPPKIHVLDEVILANVKGTIYAIKPNGFVYKVDRKGDIDQNPVLRKEQNVVRDSVARSLDKRGETVPESFSFLDDDIRFINRQKGTPKLVS